MATGVVGVVGVAGCAVAEAVMPSMVGRLRPWG